MNILKKTIICVLCISMLLGVLASCGVDKPQTDASSSTSTDTEAETNAQNDPEKDPSASAGEETLVIYPDFDERIERDYMYSVSVTQGDRTEALTVYNHVEDAPTVDRGNEGVADEYRRFASFAFEGEGVRVDIKVNRDFTSYSVMPSAKNFKNEFKDGVISVYLDKPEYFLVRLDGKDSTIISILADAPEKEEDIPKAGSNVHIIEDWYEVEGGVWYITEPDTTIYIKPGAVLNARLDITASNCKVIGHGAIVDPFGNIYKYDETTPEAQDGVLIYIKNCSNTVIDGIHILDSKAFNIFVKGQWPFNGHDPIDDPILTENTRVTNVKILSSQICSDGITLNSSTKNSLAERCFIYCGDNALLSQGGGNVCRDIIIGTTCNAMCPQGNLNGWLVEDIYIFRADEGLINDESDYAYTTEVKDAVIRNIYADDVTCTGYLLYVEISSESVVVSTGDGLLIENFHVPKLSSIGAWYFYRSDVYCGDFAVHIKNLYIDGKLAENIEHGTVGGSTSYGTNTFKYTADAAEKTAPVSIVNTVNHTCPDKVMVGKYQVFFERPIIRESNTVYLPYDQIKAELRTDKDADTVTVDGIKYVDVSKLAGAGMAVEATVTENTVEITPIAPKSDEDLLLPYTGIVSKYTKAVSYNQNTVTSKDVYDNVIYSTINKSKGTVGLFRLIDEEIQKYGVGKYRLTFQAKSDSDLGKLTAIFDCSAGDTEQTFDTSFKWQTYELEFAVTSLKLSGSLLAIRFQSDDAKFDIKDIALVKVS